ncbi:unnamed protein product [Boreogadus saida]
MLHRRKAQLIQLAFEKDLTHKFTSEWKDMLMRRFSSEKRRRRGQGGREDKAESTQMRWTPLSLHALSPDIAVTAAIAAKRRHYAASSDYIGVVWRRRHREGDGERESLKARPGRDELQYLHVSP